MFNIIIKLNTFIVIQKKKIPLQYVGNVQPDQQ
jgi:hypothetical protein